jgi:hypothetical protein
MASRTLQIVYIVSFINRTAAILTSSRTYGLPYAGALFMGYSTEQNKSSQLYGLPWWLPQIRSGGGLQLQLKHAKSI